MSTTITDINPPMTFRPIPGCPGYRAGSDGAIWTCLRPSGRRGGRAVSGREWRRLSPDVRKSDGRQRYTLKQDDGTYRRTYGGVFVLEAFVGPRPEGMECCHNDGDCTNDSRENVRWDTPVANKGDMLTHGTRRRGERINTAKLTADDVREIRRIGRPLKPLAERFGVTESLISLILKRKAWAHVD